MKKNLYALTLGVMALGLFVLNPVSVNATTFNTETVKPLNDNDTSTSTGNKGSSNETISEDTFHDPNSMINEVVPQETTLEGIFGKAISKIAEIIANFKTILLYACVGGFMVSAAIAGFEALGHRGSPMRGIVAALVFAVAYTCIKYGPTIVEAFSSWLIS